jgi:serine/threonine protein kinase
MGDIVKGMLHLHQEKIVHRDLAARNVLLQYSADLKTMKAKIADFVGKVTDASPQPFLLLFALSFFSLSFRV